MEKNALNVTRSNNSNLLSRNKEFIIVTLYACTEFIPRFGGYDVMGSQWLYLSVLNLAVSIYFLVKKIQFHPVFFRSSLFFIYLSFLFISLLSFLASYNILESIVTYSRLLVCILTLINLYILISRNRAILKSVFILLGLIALIQSIYVLIEFCLNYSASSTLDEIVYSITGNTGHKNILAASIVIKIPFLLYAIHIFQDKRKAFFLTSLMVCFLAVFFLNVRSSFLGLFIQILLYSIIVIRHYFNTGRKQANLKNLILIGAVLIVSLLTVQAFIVRAGSNKNEVKYGTVLSRIKSIDFSETGSSGRTLEWGNAVDFIKKHPVFGGGLGNWKINTIPYEKHYQPGFIYNGRRVHNDFLEVTTDIGLLGGLLYLGIFICIIIYGIRILKSQDISLEIKILLSPLLLSLSAYIIDASLNFPFERANMQANLAIILSAILYLYFTFYTKKKKTSVKPLNRSIIYFLLLLSVITTYFNYEVFRSMQLLYKISYYWIKSNTNTWLEHHEDNIPFRAADINPLFPWIPNIDGYGMPIACIKAKFLTDEQKYDEALKILNNDKGSNPYIFYQKYLRSIIAGKLNQPDSAYYYAKLAYYNRPANLDLFYFLFSMATARKDTLEMNRAFREITRWNLSPQLWYNQAQTLCKVTGDASSSLTIVDEGLKKFLGDTLLSYQKYFYTGFEHFKQQDYSKGIEFFKKALMVKENPFAYQNIAFSYYNQKLYPEAILYFTATIKTGVFRDGEMEFLRGVCYRNLNNKDSACSDFRNAKSKGYNVEPSLLNECR